MTVNHGKAIAVDGPLVGKLFDIPTYGVINAMWTIPSATSATTPEPVTYRVYSVSAFGKIIRVFACMPGGPHNTDLFNVLLTAGAAQAIKEFEPLAKSGESE